MSCSGRSQADRGAFPEIGNGFHLRSLVRCWIRKTGRAAILSGAKFIVSPLGERGPDPSVLPLRGAHSTGSHDAHEIVSAWEAGADMVKVCPGAQSAARPTSRRFGDPLPHIPLVPTGGVNLLERGRLIRAGASALGVGGELVDSKAIKEGNFGRITQKTREYLDVIEKARAGGCMM